MLPLMEALGTFIEGLIYQSYRTYLWRKSFVDYLASARVVDHAQTISTETEQQPMRLPSLRLFD